MKDYLKTMRQQAVQQQLQDASGNNQNPAETYEANIKALQQLVGISNPDGKFGDNTYSKLKAFSSDPANANNPQLALVNEVIALADNEVKTTRNNKKTELNRDPEFIAGVNSYVLNANNAAANAQQQDLAQPAGTLTFAPKEFVGGKDSAGIEYDSYRSFAEKNSDAIITALATAAAKGTDGSVDQVKLEKYKKLFNENRDAVIQEFANEVGLGAALASVGTAKDAKEIAAKLQEKIDDLSSKNSEFTIGGHKIKVANVAAQFPNKNVFGFFDNEEEVKQAGKKVVDDEDNKDNPIVSTAKTEAEKKGFFAGLADQYKDSPLGAVFQILSKVFREDRDNGQQANQNLSSAQLAQDYAQQNAEEVSPENNNQSEHRATTRAGAKVEANYNEKADVTLAKATGQQKVENAKLRAEEIERKGEYERAMARADDEFEDARNALNVRLKKEASNAKKAKLDHDGNPANNVVNEETKFLNNLDALRNDQSRLYDNGNTGMIPSDAYDAAAKIQKDLAAAAQKNDSAYSKLLENFALDGNQLTPAVIAAVNSGQSANLNAAEQETYNLIRNLGSDLANIGVITNGLESASYTPADPNKIAQKLVEGASTGK